jgi:hypothetical protein
VAGRNLGKDHLQNRLTDAIKRKQHWTDKVALKALQGPKAAGSWLTDKMHTVTTTTSANAIAI